ncbi:hypothetical protein IFR05_003277 [Cadophora sp. M221]|nr:hypothetical protein IFR05_003277 [Cadophora sp. M221]
MATLVATPSRIPGLDSALEIKDLQQSRDAYFKTLENTVLLGSRLENPSGRWAKVTETDAVDLSNVHGHIFVLTSDGFIAYKYHNGPMPDLSSVGKEFFANFIDYLITNHLANLLGLQVLLDGMDQTIWELILEQRTVMLDSAVVHGCSPTRITGWKFEARDGQPRVCQANEIHSEMTLGNHKVFNAGKPQPKLSDVNDLKKTLVDAGVL